MGSSRAKENGHGVSPPKPNSSAIRTLEVDLQNARDSERHILELLTTQTKQLEQTKIQLEEAKLEIRTLRDAVGSVEETEMARLRHELHLATAAEEKSKKAMDDLASALKEVATEANETRQKLKAMETECRSARAEADHTMSMLKAADERVRSTVEGARRTKSDADEAAALWQSKEDGFVERIKSLHLEITRLTESNEKLCSSQRSLREEVSKLRDIMKQAVNEATVAKEALVITGNENSRLHDALEEKEGAIQKAKQELDCLKLSEASALASVEELKNLLAAAHPDSAWVESGRAHASFRLPEAHPKLSEEIAKHRKFASMGSISMRKASGSVDGSSCEFDLLSGEEMSHSWGSPARKKKKKSKHNMQLLRKFGDLLRRGFRNNR